MSSSVVLFGESPEVFARLESEVGLVTVVRVCTDGAELLATLAAGLARYVIFVDQFDEVDSGLVDSVHAAGGRAVAVTNDAAVASRLLRLGVGSVSRSSSAEVIAEALSRAGGLVPEQPRSLPKRRGLRHIEPKLKTPKVVDLKGFGVQSAASSKSEPVTSKPDSASPQSDSVPPKVEPAPSRPEPVPTKPEPAPSGPESAPTKPEPTTTEQEPAPSQQESASPQPSSSSEESKPAGLKELKPRAPLEEKSFEELVAGIPDDLSQLYVVDPRTGMLNQPENQTDQADSQHAAGHKRGRIIVVWSGAGAPGRSFLAIELATEAALAGKKVTLVDADTRASSIAARLGMLGETSGIVRLCRSVEAGTFSPTADTDAHARIRIGKAVLRVTTGLPRPSRWQEVGKAALKRSLEALRQGSEVVIVDVAAPADNDHDVSFDTFAPQRDDATLTALEVADDVVVVGTADAVGLPRLMRAAAYAPELTQARISVVVNQVSKGAVRGVKRAWERFGPKTMQPEVFIPKDAEAVEHALEAATAFSHSAPRSPVRAVIREFAQSLCECEENLETPLKQVRGRRFKARLNTAPSVTRGT